MAESSTTDDYSESDLGYIYTSEEDGDENEASQPPSPHGAQTGVEGSRAGSVAETNVGGEGDDEASDHEARAGRKRRRISKFKKATRSYRAIYAHNQREREMYLDIEWMNEMRSLDVNTVDCIDYSDVNLDMFERMYMTVDDCRGKPVVIRGAMEEWPCFRGDDGAPWTVETMKRHFGEVPFTVSEGYEWGNLTVEGRLKLKHYLRYIETVENLDGPRAIIRDSYEIPEYFKMDSLNVPSKKRPAPSFLLIGPERSGTEVHTDPVETSAWNALISGRKRWCFFPPETPRSIVTGNVPEEVTNCAAYWWKWIYPQLRGKVPGMKEFIQEPGEVVFVPSGWWHVVLNVEMAIAVTHNFIPPCLIHHAFGNLAKSKPRFARRWRKAMILEDESRKSEIPRLPRVDASSDESSSGWTDIDTRCPDSD